MDQSPASIASSCNSASPHPSPLPARPSRLSLPVELLSLIVDELCETTAPLATSDRLAGHAPHHRPFARLSMARDPTDLANLSRTSRVLYEVCAPLLWQSVDLRFHSCHSLLFFLDSVLPRQRHHVRSLILGDSECPRLTSMCTGVGSAADLALQKEQVLRAAKRYTLDPAAPKRYRTRAQPVQDIFLARILEGCTAVRNLSVECLSVAYEGGVETGPGRLESTLTVLSRSEQLMRLDSLALEFPWARRFDLAIVSTILRTPSSLRTLRLAFPPDSPIRHEYARACSTLGALTSLAYLTLVDAPQALLSTLTELKSLAHLTLLTTTPAWRAPEPGLPRLPSLTHLTFDRMPSPDGAGGADFPRLSDLTLDYGVWAPLFSVFSHAPITSLTIDHFQDCDIETQLVPVLASMGSLRRMVVRYPMPVKERLLRAWAEGAGVEYVQQNGQEV